MSKDDSADSSNADDNRLYNARGNRVKIRLGKILHDHGLFAPHGININVEYTLRLPSAEDIMVVQSSQKVEGYSLKDVKIIYETIESPNIYREILSEYDAVDLPYEHVDHYKRE